MSCGCAKRRQIISTAAKKLMQGQSIGNAASRLAVTVRSDARKIGAMIRAGSINRPR